MIQVCFASAENYGEDLPPAPEKVFAPQLAACGNLHGKSVMFKPNMIVCKDKDGIISVRPPPVHESRGRAGRHFAQNSPVRMI